MNRINRTLFEVEDSPVKVKVENVAGGAPMRWNRKGRGDEECYLA